MLIGDKDRFAIEFDLAARDGGVWMYGRFCYWANNARLGDYETDTTLRDVLFSMTRVVKDNGTRSHDELYRLPAEDAFRKIDRSMYGEWDSPDKRRATEECWARLQIDLDVDVQDPWKIYLIEKEGQYKMLYSRKDEETKEYNTVCQVLLDAREVDGVLLTAFTELDALYEQKLKAESWA